MLPPRQFAFPQSNGTGESRGATFCRTAPLSPTWSYIYRTPYYCYSTHVPKKSGCQKGPFYKDINCDSCREMGLRRTMDSLTFKPFSYFDLVDTELFCGTMNNSFLVIIHPRSEKDWSYFLTLLCQCFFDRYLNPRLCSFVKESTQTVGPSGEALPINSHEKFSLRQRKLGFWAAKIIYKTEAREEKGTQL